MASKKVRIVAASVGVVVLAAIVGISATRDLRSRVKVQVSKTKRQDLVAVVSASGELKPQRFVDVSANVSGRITRLFVREGNAVRRAQVLARIDSTRFKANLQQSEAALQAAGADLERTRADLRLADLDFERHESMHEEQLVSRQVFDKARAQRDMKSSAVEAQSRRVAQMEAAVASNRDDLEKTAVISPMNGVVTRLLKEEGEVVIGAQSFQPTVVMTVGDLSVMETELLIDETDIRNVRLGQAAKVEVDAFRDLEIKGVVTEIGASAIPRGGAGAAVSSGGTSSNQAKDFKVVVTLEDPPAVLKPGLNATAEITTAVRRDALAVPIQAVVVRTVDESGRVLDPETLEERDKRGAALVKGEEQEGVFVAQDGHAVFTRVKTGTMGEADIEILEGLDEGQEIVSGSYRTLRTLKNHAGIKIKVQEAAP